jgi:hypothetical protein
MIAAKEYLLNIERLDAQINVRLSEKDDLKEKLLHITPTLSLDKGSGGGGTQDKVAGIIAKMIDLESKINADIDRFADMKQEALALLDKMENPTYMTVLHRRYFLHETFERIAIDMNYSWRWVCKLHGRALQAFDRLLKENEEG